MAGWLSKPKSLRARLHDIPALNPEGLRDCQVVAIENLEKSFAWQGLRGMGTLLADMVRVTLNGKADKKIADRAIICVQREKRRHFHLND
jgi:hypothetical protein